MQAIAPDPDRRVARATVGHRPAHVARRVGQVDHRAGHAVDHAASGAPTSNPGDAVLLPVDATAEAVDEIVTELGAQLLITGILGVPPEGETLTYTTPMLGKPDPFGVGSGCKDNDVEAAPPLRLLAFAKALGDAGPFFPACSCRRQPSA